MAHQSRKSRQLTLKTCKEISNLVLAYVNDGLSQRRKRTFEQHLDICPDCVSFLKTYRKTIQATGTLSLEKMPVTVRDSIRQFLRRRLRA